MLLAALDHNHHVGSPYQTTASGDVQLHRVWRKRTKRWDVIPRKVAKTYSYIPELITEAFKQHATQELPLRKTRGQKRTVTTTAETPLETEEIVKRKQSRFSDKIGDSK